MPGPKPRLTPKMQSGALSRTASGMGLLDRSQRGACRRCTDLALALPLCARARVCVCVCAAQLTSRPPSFDRRRYNDWEQKGRCTDF